MVTVTTDAPARLSRPDAAKYLGLSIGTLRNYHQQEKLVPEWDEERYQWMYPVPLLDAFASVNVLLCSRGEWASTASPSPDTGRACSGTH